MNCSCVAEHSGEFCLCTAHARSPQHPLGSPDPETWVTYRRDDGELVYGEYAFVTDLEFFDNDHEDYLEVTEETWVLAGRRTLKFGRTETYCAHCDEEFTLPEPAPTPHYCPAHYTEAQRNA